MVYLSTYLSIAIYVPTYTSMYLQRVIAVPYLPIHQRVKSNHHSLSIAPIVLYPFIGIYPMNLRFL
nr:MAG TPA: hypothetical protein [Caudoviricetes sp.]